MRGLLVLAAEEGSGFTVSKCSAFYIPGIET